MKRDEIMSLTGKRVELEITVLREISQAGKGKYHTFSLICGTYNTNYNNNNNSNKSDEVFRGGLFGGGSGRGRRG
jgi:hypothetical protein